mmetsp:Transcript_13929/g.24113  ORF Transcript_13929/g.24113 Transcript_13929/m.24113 type:complete len:296 (-) Transcript_13929:547-1434(-)|eukprot:CAMPEP_0171503190 /NCGR_PEP_ID=MMETSP0958-20121227/10715_1 /TAXON_ID=87120 /ORGANISM="Aurantiochytrium limacinum, Strain ATCCMYA-1381" /LENGTH=295 /DNA_ID=CAMNT_0012038567 /DNA_START=157 /DNA_END=1044 /DNA_ORIENTATION=+
MADWGYAGEVGPEQWGKLCPEYAIAVDGKAQSPIDLPRPCLKACASEDSMDMDDEAKDDNKDEAKESSETQPVTLKLKSAPGTIINNGLTIMVNAEGASSFKVNGREYELAQFHFHSPAEHTFGGVRHDLELHLVHMAKPGQGPGPVAAVVGIHFKLGDTPDPFLARVFEHVPGLTKGEVTALPELVAFNDLVIDNLFFDYEGSLTTPPCSEGIHWCVMQKVLTMTEEQLEIFRTAIPFDNYRPVQPLNGRAIEVVSCTCSKPHTVKEQAKKVTRIAPEAPKTSVKASSATASTA